MAKDRWVKLYEDMLENKLWQLPLLDRCVAILLLLKAKWSDYDYPTESGYIIHLKRGQLVATWTWIAENIGVDGISRMNIRTVIKHLENIGFLSQQSNHQLTIITICNYESYQSNGKPDNQPSNQLLTNYQPSINQPLTTDKEVVKKDKKVKKTTTTTDEKLFDEATAKPTNTDRKRERIQHWNSKPGLIKATYPPSNQMDRALDQAMQQVTDEEIDLCVDNFHASKVQWVRNIITRKAWGFYTFLNFKDGINLHRFLYGPINEGFDKNDGTLGYTLDRYAHLRGTELDR